MDVNLRSFSLLKSRLKCRDELIRELRAKMEADFREYSDRIEELTRERDALLRERDGLLRERDALQRERDALKRKTRAQELDIMQLKSDCEESRQELLFASDTPHSARPATEREDYEEDSFGPAQMTEEKADGLMGRLLPFFIDEGTARRYPNAIRGQKDTEIAMVTNTYWEKGAIQKKSRKTHLWRVLNEAKLYQARESNWNAMVDFKMKR